MKYKEKSSYNNGVKLSLNNNIVTVLDSGMVIFVGNKDDFNKTGKWIPQVNFGNHRRYECSICGKEGFEGDKYCSECGARMEGVEE